MKRMMWYLVDSLAWIMECIRKSNANSKQGFLLSSLQKPSGSPYRSSELDRLTLTSGQMVLPGIGREKE